MAGGEGRGVKAKSHSPSGILSVGARGFEPRTSRSRSVRAAELRYAPNLASGRLVARDTPPG